MDGTPHDRVQGGVHHAGGEPGFDIEDVSAKSLGDYPGRAPASDPGEDCVDIGADRSRVMGAVDRTFDLIGNAFAAAVDRLSPVGFGALSALVVLIGGITVAEMRNDRQQPPAPVAAAPASNAVIGAVGCPDIERCAVRDDDDGPPAVALRTRIHLTDLNAWTNFDIRTGQVYRTMVLASFGQDETYTLTSQCVPGAPMPPAAPLRVKHLNSSSALPGFGPYASLSMTLVRAPNCWVLVSAVVSESKPVQIARNGPRVWNIGPMTELGRASAGLVELALDPRIWVG